MLTAPYKGASNLEFETQYFLYLMAPVNAKCKKVSYDFPGTSDLRDVMDIYASKNNGNAPVKFDNNPQLLADYNNAYKAWLAYYSWAPNKSEIYGSDTEPNFEKPQASVNLYNSQPENCK